MSLLYVNDLGILCIASILLSHTGYIEAIGVGARLTKAQTASESESDLFYLGNPRHKNENR